MAIEIKEISTKKELKKFVKYPMELYKGVAQFVPPLLDMELSTVTKGKNPAYDHCEARYWMAFQNGKAVGRIGGIIHGKEIKEKSLIRFGWFDFIDDHEVSSKLMEQVVSWAKERKLASVHGPMGFTDLDFQGALVEGFDKVMTQAGLYNYPYYIGHYEKLGFGKAVDWIEQRKVVPAALPLDTSKVGLLCERYGMHVKRFKNSKEILKYGEGIFTLLNNTYNQLYGYYDLTEKQIQYYIQMYFGFVKKEFVLVITDKEDKVIGFAIMLPSLSRALQKAKGSLYPFGFLHILKAFNYNDIMDLFLIAAHDDYKNKGASAVMWTELYQHCLSYKIKEVHTGQMLEENIKVLNLTAKFADVDPVAPEIRRRCYIKNIE